MSDLTVAVRGAIGAEYGRQRGRVYGLMFADEIDLDGLTFAVVEALRLLPKGIRDEI